MSSALVSIVIPSFNRADLLRPTLESASIQSYGNLEILVVDDASTDDTEAVVTRCSSLDSRITYFRNESSRGCGGARNRGADESQGEYISFLDSDDLWHPEKVRLQAAWLEANPEYDFIACQTQHFTARPGDDPYLWNTFRGGDLLERFARIDLPFSFGATMWRRRAFDNVGRFFEKQPTSEDLDFFLRALIQGASAELQPMLLQHYRKHSQGHRSASTALSRTGATCIAIENAMRLMREARRTYDASYEMLLCTLVRHAERQLRLGEIGMATETLNSAASFAFGTRHESKVICLSNFEQPADALDQLLNDGLDWRSETIWWRTHRADKEELQPVPAANRRRRD